eukprot:38920_1
MSSYKVHSRVDNVRINKKFKNRQSGYRPKRCQYGDIWTPDQYPSKYRKSKKNQTLRKIYADWVDCELQRDVHAIIHIDQIAYDDIHVWPCPSCTYINVERLAFCSMCNHPFNSAFTPNDTPKSYQFTPKKRRPKPKRKRRKRKSPTNDFELYWKQMDRIKQYQPTMYSEWAYQTADVRETDIALQMPTPTCKIYLSKIVITIQYRTYRLRYRPECTKIWNTTIKVKDGRTYKLELYQTKNQNKYYDSTNLKSIPIVFAVNSFCYLVHENLVDVIKDEVYSALLERMNKEDCEFAADKFPDQNADNNFDNTLDFYSAYRSELHSAKYYREEAKESQEKYKFYRNHYNQNEHQMKVKVRFLLFESVLQDAIVSIDILDDDKQISKHFEYECHSKIHVSISTKNLLHMLYIAQKCFDCKHPFHAKNTVVWNYKPHRFSLLRRHGTSRHNVENALYDHIPRDIARHVLKYLYYDSVMIVNGFVNKRWINFVNTKNWARKLAYRDENGNVQYYSGSYISGADIQMRMSRGNQWGQIDLMEWDWPCEETYSDYSSSSAPIANLFGDVDSSSSD